MNKPEVPDSKLREAERKLYEAEFYKIGVRDPRGFDVTSRQGIVEMINKTQLSSDIKKEIWAFPLSANPALTKPQFNYLMRYIALKQAKITSPSETDVQNPHFQYIAKIYKVTTHAFNRPEPVPDLQKVHGRQNRGLSPKTPTVPLPDQTQMINLLRETSGVKTLSLSW